MGQTMKRDDGHIYYVIGSAGGQCDCERVPVDTEFDVSSNNPIANAVVAAAIAELRAREYPVDTVLDKLSDHAVANSVVAAAIENIKAVTDNFEAQEGVLVLNKALSVKGALSSEATEALASLSADERTISGMFFAINGLLAALGAKSAHNLTTPEEVGFTDSAYLTNNTKLNAFAKNNRAVVAPSGSDDTPRGVFYSNNGTIFKGTVLSSGVWSEPVWTGKRFLIGGTDGIFASEDGRVWTSTGVTSPAGKILAVNVGSDVYCYCGKRKSIDGGQTWDGAAEDTKLGINRGAVIGTNVVSHNPAGKGLLLSKDGGEFVAISSTTPFDYYDLVTGNGIIVAVPVDKSGKVLVSYDGESWSEIGLPSNKFYYGAFIHNSVVYVSGEDGVKYAEIAGTGTVFTWKDTNLRGRFEPISYLAECNCFVATSSDVAKNVWVSEDGVNWFATKYVLQALKPIGFVDQILFPTVNFGGIKRIPLDDFKYAVGVALRSTPVDTIEELSEDFSEEEMRTCLNSVVRVVNTIKSICIG